MLEKYLLRFYNGQDVPTNANAADLFRCGIVQTETVIATLDVATDYAKKIASLSLFPGLANKAWVNVYRWDQFPTQLPQGKAFGSTFVHIVSYKNAGSTCVEFPQEQQLHAAKKQ